MSISRLSLFWKIWLSTSVALTVLFALTGWVVQRHAMESTSRGLEEEVQVSFQAYVSLWRARAESLRSVAAIVSSLPHVRAAFGTRDEATIRDAAQEVWDRISGDLKETAFFLVTDPEGHTIASLGEGATPTVPKFWPVVHEVRPNFPEQVSGFFAYDDELVQLVLTPVYVDSMRGPALISVLVAGYAVNHTVAQRLKEATGGSDFVFTSADHVFASTLGGGSASAGGGFVSLSRDLIDLHGRPIGTLRIFRSFEAAHQRIAALRRDVILIWLCAISAGLALSYVLARKIVRPLGSLDQAASEVSRQNYDHRVKVDSQDEFGRLATTFNAMCESLQSARGELIRRERLSTIGKLAGSIVHDLRSPLAAIYGGAEMLVDAELSQPQTQRLASSIYRASRRIQELLQDLVNVAGGRTEGVERCRLREIVAGSVDTLAPVAESQAVELVLDVPEEIELPAERSRLERVFHNLVANALEAMPGGGRVRIAARLENGNAHVEVEDTGPGISPEIRDQLFQPFVSFGKKNGLGLGLALSRQTVLDHGGDLWVEASPAQGARFHLRLPL